MTDKEIKNWTHGIVDAIEPDSIPVGSFSRALNMLTLGDHFELRRGSVTIGADAGSGSVAGLGVAAKLDADATEVMFRKIRSQRKIQYYLSASGAWAETGSDATPAAANEEDFAFDVFNSQAGSQAFFSSALSSIYKIMTANPGSITDLASTAYRGYIRIKQSRMFLWNRNAGSGKKDEANPYLSFIDSRQYTTVAAESVGTGDGATKTFAFTLAFKAAGTKRTCFGLSASDEDDVETFVDNRDGTLTGSLGGTGTINYTTGALSVTFNSAPAGGKDILADYQWEDSTDDGLADFGFSGTRIAGEGNVFLQGDGGPLMAIESYKGVEYCGHKSKIWTVENTEDDTNAKNVVFLDGDGVPNWRAMRGTSKGVVYVKDDPEKPQIKIASLIPGSTGVTGDPISANIRLSGYRFDMAEVNEFGDYITVSCRTSDSPANNRYLLYNKVWKCFDIVDYWGLVSVTFERAFCIGESITGNVVQVFSGEDDDGSVIDGFAELNEWDLDMPDKLKSVKRLWIEGNIGPDQRFGVYAAPDGGNPVRVGQISGAGSYVDRSQRVDVGSLTLGRGEVGGGSSNPTGITAYHYFRELSLRVGRFEKVTVGFRRENDEDVPSQEGIGYFGVSRVVFHDVRAKARKIARKYRS